MRLRDTAILVAY